MILSSSTPAPVAATYSSCRSSTHVDRISVGVGGVPPWGVSAPDLDVGGRAWVPTRLNWRALSRFTVGRSSRQERKRPWGWLTRCVYFFLAG